MTKVPPKVVHVISVHSMYKNYTSIKYHFLKIINKSSSTQELREYSPPELFLKKILDNEIHPNKKWIERTQERRRLGAIIESFKYKTKTKLQRELWLQNLLQGHDLENINTYFTELKPQGWEWQTGGMWTCLSSYFTEQRSVKWRLKFEISY